MNKWQFFLVLCLIFTGTPQTFGQYSGFGYPNQRAGHSVDLMDSRNFSLSAYRRMFNQGQTPTLQELHGTWRGVNKGIVTLAGFKQFVKQIEPACCMTFGTNIQTHQVSAHCLRSLGWQPKIGPTGRIEQRGNFQVKSDYRSIYQNSVEFSYRDGGNPVGDASRLLVDRVTKIDDNHMLGRASIQIGRIQIPIAYFMLERVGSGIH